MSFTKVTAAGIGTTSTVAFNFSGGLIISGVTTVSAGSTSAPTISPSGDTNTGIFFPSADTIAFAEGGAEVARIDSSARLLLGTTASYNVGSTGSALLQSVVTSSIPTGSFTRYTNDNDGAIISLGKSRGTSAGSFTVVQSGDIIGNIRFAGADGTDLETQAASIRCEVDGTPGANDMPGRLVFSITADGASSPTERMRITNGGDILFGTTGRPNGTSVYGSAFTNQTNDRLTLLFGTSSSATQKHVIFHNPNGEVGSISTNASATAYTTSSDYRLKENITPLTGAASRVQQLKPSRFNFIADPDTEVDGFIAHEVQSVVPEAVVGDKDAVDADGEPIYQGIDQSKLVPLLTAALQEAIGEIESLKARLTAAGI